MRASTQSSTQGFECTLPCGAGRLEKLQLHGNALHELPQSISGLTSLKSLSLQGNALQSLPNGISCLQVGVSHAMLLQ